MWEVCFVYGEVFLGYTEKRKACFLPATRKRLFANSDFALRQRAEGFQRATGKPFGRLRRGEILCDTGKRKVGTFPVCRKEAVLYLELSSQVQQRIEENLKRGLPAEAFARSTVEFGNEGCYLSLAEVLHINRLGTVFTD